MLCKIIGHKGPEGATYSLNPSLSKLSSMKWHCPRCGESERAVMVGQLRDGVVIDNPRSILDLSPSEKKEWESGNQAFKFFPPKN